MPPKTTREECAIIGKVGQYQIRESLYHLLNLNFNLCTVGDCEWFLSRAMVRNFSDRNIPNGLEEGKTGDRDMI